MNGLTFDILEKEPERVDKLWSNTRHYQAALRSAGLSTGDSETPITPIIVGETAAAFAAEKPAVLTFNQLAALAGIYGASVILSYGLFCITRRALRLRERDGQMRRGAICRRPIPRRIRS